MEYRRMGRTGLRVSTICLGTMTFGFQTDESAAHRIMDIAWDAGVNFLDSSDVYPMGSEDTGTTEEIVGTWLTRMPRDRVVVATKARGATGEGPNDVGLSRQHILSAVDASLERLGTDYIDLYQTHFPDSDTPIDETLKALDDLVRWGKVRYIGCSNYQAWDWRGRWRRASGWTSPGTTATSPATTSSTARSRTSCCPCAGQRGSASSPITRSRAGC